jgi:hypothetical protein
MSLSESKKSRKLTHGSNRTREYDLSEQPWEPVSGAATALLGGLSNFMVGTVSLPSDIVKAVKSRKTIITGPSKPGDPISRASTEYSDAPSKGSTNTQTDQSVNYVRGAAGVISKDWVHLLKIPRELILGMGKGFHNAPKLYHDRTTRTPDKVTDLKSGLKNAGKELSYQMYDAVTGLVTQPYQGAKEEGAVGILKGAGKGIGGLLLKPEAGKSLIAQ